MDNIRLVTTEDCKPMEHGFTDFRGTEWPNHFVDLHNMQRRHLENYIGRDWMDSRVQSILDGIHQDFCIRSEVLRYGEIVS